MVVTYTIDHEEHETHVYGLLKDNQSELMKKFSQRVILHDSNCNDEEGTYYLLHQFEEFYEITSPDSCNKAFDIWDCQKKHFLRIMDLRRPNQLQQTELLGLESGEKIKLTVLNHQQVKFSCAELLEKTFTNTELSNLQDLYSSKKKKTKEQKLSTVKQFYEAALRDLLLFLYDTFKFNILGKEYNMQEDIELCVHELDNFFLCVSLKLRTSIANYTLMDDDSKKFLCNEFDNGEKVTLDNKLQQQNGAIIKVKGLRDKIRRACKDLCSSNIKHIKGVAISKNKYQMTKDVVDTLPNEDDKMKTFIVEVLQMTIAAVKPHLNTSDSADSEPMLTTDQQPSSPTPQSDALDSIPNSIVTILANIADIADIVVAHAISNATGKSPEPVEPPDYYPCSSIIHAQKDDGGGLNFILYITSLYLKHKYITSNMLCL